MQATQTRQTTAVASETTQEISQLQSTEVVQTLLHSSISELCNIRCLLPDNSFADVYYPTKQRINYEEFARGEHDQGKQSKGDRTLLHLLLRDKNPGANRLLDWLQKGAFEVLSKRWLRALQLNIYTDAKDPRRVIESYTFNFTYNDDLNSADSINVTLTSSQGSTVGLRSVRHALHTFLRQLAVFCGSLPQLPDRRYLSMNLFYTDDCPDHYQPHLFESSEDTGMCFAHGDGWKPESAKIGSMNSSYHTSSLVVAYLAMDSYDETERIIDRELPLVIPSQLSHTLNRPADTDVRKRHSSREPEWVVEQSSKASESLHKTAKQPVRGSKSMNLAPTITKSSHEHFSESQFSTQTRKDVRTRNELRELLKSPQNAESLEETQQIPQTSFGGDNDSQFFKDSVPMSYSQAKIIQLRSRQTTPTKHKAHREESVSTMDVDEHQIACSCGFDLEEDCMICCDFCGKWQHAYCHGYLSLKDGRIPNEHACYKCLLDESEASLFQELSDLALLRRATMHIKQTGGLRSVKALSEDLHCDLPTASDVTRHLKSKGYLFDAPNSHSRGFAQTGLPRSTLVKNGPKYGLMMKGLFDPTTGIAHHLETSSSISTRDLPYNVTAQTPQLASPMHSTKPPSREVAHGSEAPTLRDLNHTSRQTMSLRLQDVSSEPSTTSKKNKTGKRGTGYTVRNSLSAEDEGASLMASTLSDDIGAPQKRASKRLSKQNADGIENSSPKRLKMSTSCGGLDVSYRSPSSSSVVETSEH